MVIQEEEKGKAIGLKISLQLTKILKLAMVMMIQFLLCQSITIVFIIIFNRYALYCKKTHLNINPLKPLQ